MCLPIILQPFYPFPHLNFFKIPIFFFFRFGFNSKKSDHPSSLALIQLPQKHVLRTCESIKVHMK